MLTLHTNWINVVLRIVALLLVILMEYTTFVKLLLKKENKDIAFGIFNFALLFFVIIGIVWSFFQILKVTVDKTSGSITLSRLHSTKVITKNEIEGYYTTRYINPFSQIFRGLILKTINNEFFKLDTANVKSIYKLKQFLEEENFKFLGKAYGYGK